MDCQLLQSTWSGPYVRHVADFAATDWVGVVFAGAAFLGADFVTGVLA